MCVCVCVILSRKWKRHVSHSKRSWYRTSILACRYRSHRPWNLWDDGVWCKHHCHTWCIVRLHYCTIGEAHLLFARWVSDIVADRTVFHCVSHLQCERSAGAGRDGDQTSLHIALDFVVRIGRMRWRSSRIETRSKTWRGTLSLLHSNHFCTCHRHIQEQN